jgi:hypothetical protein
MQRRRRQQQQYQLDFTPPCSMCSSGMGASKSDSNQTVVFGRLLDEQQGKLGRQQI